MFAVIRTGSKQYKVSEGDLIDVELLEGAEPGKSTVFNDVLLVSNGNSVSVGKPTVAGASVTGEVMGEVKGDKVIAFKYRRTEGYHRTVGHRQRYLRVKIGKIKS